MYTCDRACGNLYNLTSERVRPEKGVVARYSFVRLLIIRMVLCNPDAEGAVEDTRRKAEEALAALIAEQEAAQQVRTVATLQTVAHRLRCIRHAVAQLAVGSTGSNGAI